MAKHRPLHGLTWPLLRVCQKTIKHGHDTVLVLQSPSHKANDSLNFQYLNMIPLQVSFHGKNE